VDVELIDVTVRIYDDLAPGDLRHLEDVLRGIDGVVSTHASRRHPHVMLVEFNPRRTSSIRIIDTITQDGVNAELAVPEAI
jgi:hypothetical protein